MNGKERRKQIIELLQKNNVVSGSALASVLNVSRQVVVQDIALLRATGANIYSTSRGYLLESSDQEMVSRIFKLIHSDEDVTKELTTIVDLGGRVDDVFVYHKVYGILQSEIHIKSRLDIKNYVHQINSGSSSLLKNITSGYHYHTVFADSEEILDMIQEALDELGFLAPLSDYEPVDFWSREHA